MVPAPLYTRTVETSLRIHTAVLEALIRHARADSGQECCGFLAGRDDVITHVFPATNASPHPATSYEIAPREIFGRIREMRASRLELLGIYHSHPSTPNEPSPRDIEQAYYPAAAYFILSPLPNAPRPVRAFSIRDARFTELEIQVLSVQEEE
jgi:proteasome lid subunit RPN8/RPN11